MLHLLWLLGSFGWLGPFFWGGYKGKVPPAIPAAFAFQYTAAGLFTQRSTKWWDHHLEIQDAKDLRIEFAERKAFPMGAFGYRTRYDRILIETNRSPFAKQVRQRLAEHVMLRLERGAFDPIAECSSQSSTQPFATSLKAVRLVRSLWSVGSEGMVSPTGRWNPPPVYEIASADRQVLGTYKIEEGKLVEVLPMRIRMLGQKQPAKPPSESIVIGSKLSSNPGIVRKPSPREVRVQPVPQLPPKPIGSEPAFVRPPVSIRNPSGNSDKPQPDPATAQADAVRMSAPAPPSTTPGVPAAPEKPRDE